jgi:hypothetical protein
MAVTAEEMEDFTGYLRNCTDAQVRGVYEKEMKAGRKAYAFLAKLEAERRGISVE